MDPANYSNGFAQNPSEALHPYLWDGLVLCLEPSIGIQGDYLWDFSGKGHHGTFNAFTANSWVSGREGYAVELDGIDDTITIADHNDFSQNDTLITIMFWTFATTPLVASPFIWKRSGAGASNFARWAIVNDGVGFVHFLISTNGSAFDVDVSIAEPVDAGWHQYVATMDGSFARLHLDRFEAGNAAAATMGASTNDITIGSSAGSASYTAFYAGRFYDLRVYNRCLTRSEIYESYAGATPLTRNPYPLKQRGILKATTTFSATLTFSAVLRRAMARAFAATMTLTGVLTAVINRFLRPPAVRDKVDVKHTYTDYEG